MSTDYRLDRAVSWDALLHELSPYGIAMGKLPEGLEGSEPLRPLTDGQNYVWCKVIDGMVGRLKRGGPSIVEPMLEVIAWVFQVQIRSEHGEIPFWPSPTRILNDLAQHPPKHLLPGDFVQDVASGKEGRLAEVVYPRSKKFENIFWPLGEEAVAVIVVYETKSRLFDSPDSFSLHTCKLTDVRRAERRYGG